VPHLAVARLVRATDYVKFGPDEVFPAVRAGRLRRLDLRDLGRPPERRPGGPAPEGAVALSDLGDLIDRHGITTVFLTTALFHLMVDHQLARLSPLRQLLTAAS